MLAKHTAATKKASRLRRVVGVEIGGTKHDVRRDPSKIKRYTSAQLKAYDAVLTGFNSRQNGFVAGHKGAILTAADVKAYRRVEAIHNKIGAKVDAEVGGVYVPIAGRTIAERDMDMQSKRARGQGGATHRPYTQVKRNMANVTGTEALHALTKQMERKVQADYVPKEIKRGRKELKMMLKDIGATQLMKMADTLTDAQFNVLWNYTKFASSISSAYETITAKNTEGANKDSQNTYEDQIEDAKELLDWAGTVDTTQRRKSKTR